MKYFSRGVFTRKTVLEVSAKVITREWKGIIQGFVRNIAWQKEAEQEKERMFIELKKPFQRLKR